MTTNLRSQKAGAVTARSRSLQRMVRRCGFAGQITENQKPKPMTEIEALTDDYYKAANALVTYREKNGFNPGAHVRGQWRDYPAITGIIAPYGDMWGRVNHECVPVLRDDGVLQPWAMSNLTIIAEDVATPNDPKLSDGGAWRGSCVVERRADIRTTGDERTDETGPS